MATSLETSINPEFFHQDTWDKAFEALKRSGLTKEQALEGMREMANDGVIFRERFKI